MTKKIHNLVQGSADWESYRLTMRGASEAAAMLGLSPNVSRTELLHMKHTATPQEFSDWVQKNILDYGHEVEAMARPLAEEIIGTELYPATCSDGLLSASCDGLTMAEDEGWEHKQWNEALADSVTNNVLPDSHQPQVQQELMVTGAQRWLFMVSDGTPERMVYMWVYPDQAWFERIRAGWDQFETDLANYEPKQYATKPEAEPIMSLPALVIQIQGKVAASNLPAFQARAERFIASIKTDLVTDQDFADAEATVKFCEKAEGDLEQAKRAALEQTVDIAEVMRTIDHVREQLRAKRLVLERTVKDKKELIKAGILANAKQAFADHVAALEREIAPLRLVFQARDFVGAMKNKRTLATLQDAVDTELANGKIAVDALAAAVRGRLTWYREHAAQHEFLFADLQTIIQKPDEDFQLVVRARIDNHKRIEDEKAEQARQRAADSASAPVPTLVPVTPSEEARTVLADDPRWPFPTEGAAVTPIDTARAPVLDDDAMLRLGQINERLAPIQLTAEGLARLGFAHAMTDKSAKLYRESDFHRICAALMRHIDSVSRGQQAA